MIPCKKGKQGEARKIDKVPRAREEIIKSWHLGSSLAAWLEVPPSLPPPPAGCLGALLVIRNAALQLYCFPVVFGYQNICVLGGFGSMKA